MFTKYQENLMDIIDGKATLEKQRLTEKLNENIEIAKVNYHLYKDNDYMCP